MMKVQISFEDSHYTAKGNKNVKCPEYLGESETGCAAKDLIYQDTALLWGIKK